MRPILLSGHERALNQVKYNADGDLIFSVSRDQVICAWFSANGERLGTYRGHQGAVVTISADPTTTLLASGAADNALKIWDIKSGKCLKTWDFNTAIRRVEFNEDGTKLLAVSEKRMGYLGTIMTFEMPGPDSDADFPADPSLRITLPDAKAMNAAWGPMSDVIVAGLEDGSVAQFDAITGEILQRTAVHTETIQDLQMAQDRTYFITASKDKSAKLITTQDLKVLKTYVADTPLMTAAITPLKPFVILGGGQDSMTVTQTSARQGKFEARIYHKIFEEEIGRVRGHFGPINTISVHPKGEGYCSGGEDGYVRLHHFDKAYFNFEYEVEKEQSRM